MRSRVLRAINTWFKMQQSLKMTALHAIPFNSKLAHHGIMPALWRGKSLFQAARITAATRKAASQRQTRPNTRRRCARTGLRWATVATAASANSPTVTKNWWEKQLRSTLSTSPSSALHFKRSCSALMGSAASSDTKTAPSKSSESSILPFRSNFSHSSYAASWRQVTQRLTCTSKTGEDSKFSSKLRGNRRGTFLLLWICMRHQSKLSFSRLFFLTCNRWRLNCTRTSPMMSVC